MWVVFFATLKPENLRSLRLYVSFTLKKNLRDAKRLNWKQENAQQIPFAKESHIYQATR